MDPFHKRNLYHTPKETVDPAPIDTFSEPHKKYRKTTYTDFMAKRKKTLKRRQQRKVTRKHQNRYGK